MNFLTQVIGPPLATEKPIRCGSYSVLLTTKGFVVGDPMAFGSPELMEETASLSTGSGYLNGRLHLHSRRFPMYYPGAIPRLLLLSPHLTVIPSNGVGPELRRLLLKACHTLEEIESPDPEVLRNIMPCFEIFQDSRSTSPA